MTLSLKQFNKEAAKVASQSADNLAALADEAPASQKAKYKKLAQHHREIAQEHMSMAKIGTGAIGAGLGAVSGLGFAEAHAKKNPKTGKVGLGTRIKAGIAGTLGGAAAGYVGDKITSRLAGEGSGIPGKIFKSEENKMTSLFKNDPIMTYWKAMNLTDTEARSELFKAAAIEAFVNENITHWSTKDGAEVAVAYLSGDDLRKAVYLDYYDRHVAGTLAKSNNINYLTEIAQRAEFELNKAYGDTVQPNKMTAYPNQSIGSGNVANPDAGAQQSINNTPTVGDPAKTSRKGKGVLVADYAAAFKQATANPINISPTSQEQVGSVKPTGPDLSRAEGATDLQKSIQTAIAKKLREGANKLGK